LYESCVFDFSQRLLRQSLNIISHSVKATKPL
jgi:hypothetical protein